MPTAAAASVAAGTKKCPKKCINLIVEDRLILWRQSGNWSRILAGTDRPVALDVVAELPPPLRDVIIRPLWTVLWSTTY